MKPYTICHMVTTIDGKILSERWPQLPGNKSSRSLFETTAASFGIGAWIVGTTTMKEFSAKPFRLPKAGRRIPHSDHIAKPGAKTLAIGVDTKAQLRWKESEVDGDHVVLLLTEKTAGADYLAHLQNAGVSYLFCGQRDVDLRLALHKLATAFGLRKVMIQGGGKMNGSFLQAGLIDEISHVVIPVADGGGGVSSIFDIAGPPPKKAAATLRLRSMKKLPGSVHWFRYLVTSRHRK